jgi:dolichol-phosphate mannosyltransferase
MFENKTIDVVVPCFNEQDNINNFYDRLIKTLNKIKINYRIIFVDDGSKDKTWEKILLLKKTNEKIFGIKLSRNFGHQSALKAGIDFADSDYVFSLDADLQDPPELLEEMLLKLKNENLNVVNAKRKKNNERFFKRITSYSFYYILNKISKTTISQQVSDFRLIDNKVLTKLKDVDENDLFFRGLIPWLGFNSSEVFFERQNRSKGETGWSINKMIDFAITGIFNFSNLPMKISFILTILMSFVFLIFTGYALKSYFSGDVVRGWTSLVLIISFFNIIIFFVLGLISEYVGRIYFEVKKRPSYIIDEKT